MFNPNVVRSSVFVSDSDDYELMEELGELRDYEEAMSLLPSSNSRISGLIRYGREAVGVIYLRYSDTSQFVITADVVADHPYRTQIIETFLRHSSDAKKGNDSYIYPQLQEKD